MPGHINTVPVKNLHNVLVKVSPECCEDDEGIGCFDDAFEAFQEVSLKVYLGVMFCRVEHAVNIEEDDGTTAILRL